MNENLADRVVEDGPHVPSGKFYIALYVNNMLSLKNYPSRGHVGIQCDYHIVCLFECIRILVGLILVAVCR